MEEYSFASDILKSFKTDFHIYYFALSVTFLFAKFSLFI